MRNRYPLLRKLPILLPFFWIWRSIYALIFRGGKLKEEVGAVSETNQQLLQKRLDFYHRCGINITENGSLTVDDNLLSQTATSEEAYELLSPLKDFSSSRDKRQ